MKMKKVLAAALAGTMVFAMTVPVFAATPTQIKPAWECWWNGQNDDGTPAIDTDGDGVGDYILTDEEYEAKFLQLDDLKGDGTWSVAMKCILTDNGDEEMYTVTGDVWDDNDVWLSYGTHGDCWGSDGGTKTGQNTSVDPQLRPDDIVTFTIERVGSEFTIKIAKNGTDFLRFKCSDSTLSGDKLHTRVGVQYGVFDIYPLVEGDAQAAIDEVNSSSSEKTEATTADKTETNGTTGTSGSTAGDTGSSSSGATATTTTPKTGDTTPIVAVVIAVAGCGAVAFASKKRFAK